MAAFQKFDSFVEALGRKVHNLNADTLKVMLTNVAPVAANSQKSNLTDIAAGFGYAAGGTQSLGNTYAQTAGLAKLISGDVVFTAAGGSIGPFQWAVLYNDTATNKELIGFWNYGSPVTLADTESFTVDFDGTNGVLQLT